MAYNTLVQKAAVTNDLNQCRFLTQVVILMLEPADSTALFTYEEVLHDSEGHFS